MIWCQSILVFCFLLAMSDESFLLTSTNLKIFWNIPSFQCRSFKLNFTQLAEKYGIVQNQNDDFRGANVSILYDPGNFPAILEENGKVILRNGGIPQDGNIKSHINALRDDINKLIPDVNYSGLGIIDFERWRPIFRQNFGTLSAYKTLSLDRERAAHPFWPNTFIEKEARKKFEFYARMFMEDSLYVARQLRPNAQWGYYAYPYCFNKSPSNMQMTCPREVSEENDRIHWLFQQSNILYPSLYLPSKLSERDKMELIEGRINEAHRIVGYLQKRKDSPSIIPYFWYKYHDNREFLTKEDLYNAFRLFNKLNVDGVVIWGSSADVNTKEKCINLYNYIDNVLGPIIINTL